VDPVVEDLAAKLHTLYQLEAKRQGDVRHHDDYAQLAENTKAFHRVLARFILKYASLDMVRDMLRDPLTEGAPQ
jgi:hypothetical protein